ncbi:CpaF family protein [Kineococcus gynurae]|uniref:CpaF family protein n=1 Tax=Kineococcus gynurae TaxID=452979 RepID=A0ABV5LXN5_9ACTN
MSTPVPAPRDPGAGPRGPLRRIDHDLVRALRSRVADLLSDRRRAEDARPLDPEDERAYARSLVVQVLEDHARAEVAAGRPPLSAVAEELHAAAVVAALFGVGRLQPLLEDPDVENVDVNGCDRVFVGYADGREELLDPVADTDDDLVELVQVLAANVGLSSRAFDAANPQLDLRLPDGSRLSAVMGVCRRPALSIRRARLTEPTLADLERNGTLDADLADFLAAAVRARKNIMIAGSTNSGKTTLLRALAAEIPPAERLITVERALELGLDASAAHPNCLALEERLPNAEGRGAVTLADLVRRSLRMNPSRVIVGEVLGDEIVTMLNAMSQGNDGSLSTIHANSSAAVFDRVATYALQAAERLPVEATHHLLAGALDLVVFLRRGPGADGTLRRRVASVREITGVDGRVLSSEIFATPPRSEGPARPATPPACGEDLEAVGWTGWDAWLAGTR